MASVKCECAGKASGKGPVIVAGLGLSNLEAVNYLLGKGIVPIVCDTRENPPLRAKLPENVRFIGGEFQPELFATASMVVPGPGIPLYNPAMKAAAAAGADIAGDVELFARETRSKVLAVTGSNGKSTVTTLLGLMGKAAGIKTEMGANIGVPVLSLLKDEPDLAVLELSSFELETVSSLKAVGAVCLNVTEDHLDRYEGSLEKYGMAKHRIFRNAEHIAANREDKRSFPDYYARETGAEPRKPDITFGTESGDDYGVRKEGSEYILMKKGRDVIMASEMKIVGRHNISNALAAMALADFAGIPEEAQLEVLRTFPGLRHRCEFVAKISGVSFYNDSKATNVGSTLAAVSGLRDVFPDAHIFLLAGGLGKGQDFAPVGDLLRNGAVAKMYCFGRDAAQIISASPAEKTVSVPAMKSALDAARADAKEGDIVLLAPACASMDQFKNFEVRGEEFIRMVKETA